MKTLDKTPNSRQKHLKMKITDKEKIIRGNRLRKVMDFLKLRTKDFVYDGSAADDSLNEFHLLR